MTPLPLADGTEYRIVRAFPQEWEHCSGPLSTSLG